MSKSVLYNNAKNLAIFRTNSVGTDVVLKVGLHMLPAHKLILSISSNFFKKLFFENKFAVSGNIVDFSTYSLESVQLYLQYVYGERSLEYCNWKLLLEVAQIIDFTETWWKDVRIDILSAKVPGEEFRDFLIMLNDVFHGQLETELIAFLAGQITKFVDLSGFSPEFIETIIDSPSLIRVAGEERAAILRKLLETKSLPEENILSKGPFHPSRKIRIGNNTFDSDFIVVKITIKTSNTEYQARASLLSPPELLPGDRNTITLVFSHPDASLKVGDIILVEINYGIFEKAVRSSKYYKL